MSLSAQQQFAASGSGVRKVGEKLMNSELYFYHHLFSWMGNCFSTSVNAVICLLVKKMRLTISVFAGD